VAHVALDRLEPSSESCSPVVQASSCVDLSSSHCSEPDPIPSPNHCHISVQTDLTMADIHALITRSKRPPQRTSDSNAPNAAHAKSSGDCRQNHKCQRTPNHRKPDFKAIREFEVIQTSQSGETPTKHLHRRGCGHPIVMHDVCHRLLEYIMLRLK
jgi:hypothetical protein